MRTASARTFVVVAAVLVVVGVVVGIVWLNRDAAAEPAEQGRTEPPIEVITPSSPAASTVPASPSASSETTATPEEVPGVPEAGDISREGLTAEELVIAAAETMTTWDSAVDSSETDAYRRALPLFAEEYEEIFTAPQKPTLPAEWREAAKNEAVSVPEVEITQTSEQGENTLYQVIATWTWTDGEGWELDAGPKYMEFQVRPDGEDFIIENWSENGLQ